MRIVTFSRFPVAWWQRITLRARVTKKAAAATVAASVFATFLLAGCGAIGYYGQAVHGHFSILYAARPLAQWLGDPQTPKKLQQRLRLAEQMRTFASTHLALPQNASYQSYAALGRPAAVWNVVAAPPDSLQLKHWCYPVAGCVSYRGYYSEADAQALATRLRVQDALEVQVYGVPAYSTLGWLNWLGGDPLLSTVIYWPEGELARLLFHELAHQKVYAAGDTAFNEALANAVGELGAAQWLRERGNEAARVQYEALDTRRRTFLDLVRQTQADLAQIYEDARSARTPAALDAQKAAAMINFKARYAELKSRWADAGMPWDGYDGWVAGANNASFGLLATYDNWVPAFKTIFACVDARWPRFYEVAQVLAAQPKDARGRRLQRWTVALATPQRVCDDVAALLQPTGQDAAATAS